MQEGLHKKPCGALLHSYDDAPSSSGKDGSSWARLQHPTHTGPTPWPWKHWKLQAEGCRGPAWRLCGRQLTPVWAELCSFHRALCATLPTHPAELVHGAHLPLWSSRVLVGLIFRHTNLSGAEKEEILDNSSQALGWFKLANALKIRFWNIWYLSVSFLLKSWVNPKSALGSVVFAWSAVAGLHCLFGCRHFC